MLKKEILIVDDENTILDILTRALQDEGFIVRRAISGKDSIEQFRHYHPYLILIDMNLRDGVGGAACNEVIKECDPLTISVAMSGWFNQLYSIAHLRRKGFDHFLRKPFDLERVRRIVNATYIYRQIWDEISADVSDGVALMEPIITRNGGRIKVSSVQ
jgi:DNA-binding NtrC family response regulator